MPGRDEEAAKDAFPVLFLNVGEIYKSRLMLWSLIYPVSVPLSICDYWMWCLTCPGLCCKVLEDSVFNSLVQLFVSINLEACLKSAHPWPSCCSAVVCPLLLSAAESQQRNDAGLDADQHGERCSLVYIALCSLQFKVKEESSCTAKESVKILLKLMG